MSPDASTKRVSVSTVKFPLAVMVPPVTSPVRSPVTSPVRSPVTSPVTSPVRSPVTSPVRSPVKLPATRMALVVPDKVSPVSALCVNKTS